MDLLKANLDTNVDYFAIEGGWQVDGTVTFTIDQMTYSIHVSKRNTVLVQAMLAAIRALLEEAGLQWQMRITKGE